MSPAGRISRPITDRVKESLFDVLSNYGMPGGAVVADLFAGVGSLGLEALSRGAEFVTFVEQDLRTAGLLKRNIEKAGFERDSRVIRANAFKLGAPVESGREQYNLVFVDPPYAATRDVSEGSSLSGLMDLLGGQVGADAMLAVRTEGDTILAERYGRFGVIERRRWGTMVVTILRRVGG